MMRVDPKKLYKLNSIPLNLPLTRETFSSPLVKEGLGEIVFYFMNLIT